jgi:hypothetical protein
MNRTLKRPMFRIGGPTSGGITSGLNRPRMASADMNIKIKKLTEAYDNYKKQGGTLSFQDFSKLYAEENFNSGGRVGYQTGGISVGGLPGFAISTGLNLLSQPPQGGLLSTAALAARDPFNRLQAEQAAAAQTTSDRAFAKELAEDEREFLRGETTRKLESAERIAGMDDGDVTKRLEAAREEYDDDIKAARAVEFATNKFKEFEDRFGEGQVATKEVDSDAYVKPGSIEKLVKRNPRLTGLKIYDVATNKVVVIVKNKETGKFQFVPADSADIDTTGDAMPEPKTGPDFTYLSPGQQKVVQDIQAGADKDFGIGFYD